MPEGSRPNVESNGTGNAIVRVSAAGGGAAPGTRVTIAGSEARLAAAVDAAARASTEELRTQVQAVDTGDGTAVSLPNDILFAFDSSALRPDAIETLARVAELVRREGVAQVEIVGHTDAIGSDAYNLELSERRARAVQAWLATDAALNATMLIEGRGEADPVSANTRPDGSDDPEGRQRNRRVELTMARE